MKGSHTNKNLFQPWLRSSKFEVTREHTFALEWPPIDKVSWLDEVNVWISM